MYEFSAWLAEWSQGNPTWSKVLFTCLQLLLVAIGAFASVRFFTQLSRRADTSLLSASTTNIVWLVAAGLVLLVGPVQLLTSGLSVPIERQPAEARLTGGQLVATSKSVRSPSQQSREGAARTRNLQSEIFAEPSNPAEVRPDASSAGETVQPVAVAARSVEELTAASAVDSEMLEETVSRAHETSSAISLFVILWGVYMLPVLWLLLRVVFSTARLASVVRHGEQLSAREATLAEQAAAQLQLAKVPSVIYADVAVPMVCGLRKQAVLVPQGFSDWSESEKRAVLLHEFAHILRRDAWGEFLAQAIQALYWFHPSSWLVAHKLRITRELATDERVVASGMSVGRYARDLVSVIERLSSSDSKPKHLIAVAMSDFSSVEERLSYILKAGDASATDSSRRRSLVLSSAIGVLLVAFMVGAIRLTPAVAQDDSATAAKVDLPANVVNWLDRFEQCEVREVSKVDAGFVLDLKGRLLRSDGSAAAGAIVVIRETNRSGHEFIKSGRRYTQEEKQKTRLQDVIAKVVADQNGRFRFEQVQAPYAPPYFTEEWGWDIVAFDSEGEGHLGWHHLSMQEVGESDQPIEITLRETEAIQGTITDPEGKPLVNTLVTMVGFGDQYASDGTGMMVDMSQLTMQCQTDSEGKFAFLGVPTGSVAAVAFTHPKWALGSADLATSSEVPVGEFRYFDGDETSPEYAVKASPAKLTARPGVLVQGSVKDASGKAVEGAWIRSESRYQFVRSDRDGSFELRLDVYSPGPQNRLEILSPANASFQRHYVTLTEDHILKSDPVEVQMKEGVRVSGVIAARDGRKPVSGILIKTEAFGGEDWNQSYEGRSDEEGNFQLVLPKGKFRLFLTCEDFGYAVPTPWRWDAFRRVSDPSKLESKFFVDVDTTNGEAVELDPIQVTRSRALCLNVRLPDGSVVEGAEARVKDRIPGDKPRRNVGPISASVRARDITHGGQAVRSDASGNMVIRREYPAYDPFVDIRYTDGNRSYAVKADLLGLAGNELEITLQPVWTLQGQVTLDGNPLAGVPVSISSRGQDLVGEGFVTDSKGFYSLPVEPNREYQVSISRVPLPGNPIYDLGTWQTSQQHRAKEAVDGLVLVPDFAFKLGQEELAGRVVDGQGNPVEGASVRLTIPREMKSKMFVGSSTQSKTDKDGRFHFKNLPAGSYFINASNGGGLFNLRRAQQRVQTGRLDVQLKLE